MQLAAEAALPDLAQVQRVTRTPDGSGGFSTTWATVVTAACALAPADARPPETETAARLATTAAWTITLPAGTDVRAADRIVSGGRTFELTAPAAPRSWELTRRVSATEVR